MDLRNKKILVTGANGQLGSAIVTVFRQHQIDVIGTDRRILDITNYDNVNKVINYHKPDVIIHCAAYTAVDKAESDRETCYKSNVEGTRNLAKIAQQFNIEFVYFSTDYVFDGTKKSPYETYDIPNPINYYGLTKYLGEEIVQSLLSKYYIFRISWVFGPKGKNFVNTIIRLAQEKDSIEVVNDQVGSPTYSIDVANFLSQKRELPYGKYHLSNQGYISWFDLAVEITKLKKFSCKITPIKSTFYNTPAKRPINSKLSKDKNTFLREWDKALESYINSLNP